MRCRALRGPGPCPPHQRRPVAAATAVAMAAAAAADFCVDVFEGEDGSKYYGTLKGGMPDGLGTRIWPDGSQYDGEWRAGHMHGFGTYVWKSGQRYDGEFRVSCCVWCARSEIGWQQYSPACLQWSVCAAAAAAAVAMLTGDAAAASKGPPRLKARLSGLSCPGLSSSTPACCSAQCTCRPCAQPLPATPHRMGSATASA